MSFWKIKGKIITAVMFCIVYYCCAQWYAHTWAVLILDCWFRFRFSF